MIERMWLKVWGWLKANWDGAIVIAVAIVFGVVELLGADLDPGQIGGVAIALMAFIAVMLSRVRRSSEEWDELSYLMASMKSENFFQVLEEEVIWDLTSSTSATSTIKRTIRIVRDDVSTFTHWSTDKHGDDGAEDWNIRWRRKEEDVWMAGDVVHSFVIEGGHKHLISLETELASGDVIIYELKRELDDRFPESHEDCSIENVTSETIYRQINVLWPSDRAPSDVRLRREPARGPQEPRPMPTTVVDGRKCLSVREPYGARGDKTRILWYW